MNHPSQHREGLDHMFNVTSAAPTKTRDIVDAARLGKSKVGATLMLASRAGLMTGDGNGHWSRVEDIRRTEFRDRVVRQWFLEKETLRLREAIAFFIGLMSASQLYYTVQRLRKDTTINITVERDGSRAPVYTVKEVT